MIAVKRPLAALIIAILAVISSLGGVYAEGPLPKGKTIAVIVRGASSQHARSAEAILINALIQGGYKAVDQKRLETIRQNKAAALALDGNVDAILKLGQTYGFNVLVSGNATTDAPVKNEFGLFTSTAVVSVTACNASDGRQLFADTASAKEIGYTGAEAGQKAIEAAARSAARAMIEGGSSGTVSGVSTQSFEIEVSGVRSFAEAHSLLEALSKAGCTSSSLTRFSGGRALVKASWGGNADSLAMALMRVRSDIALDRIEGNRLYLKRP
jgi:hypothetical protein